MSRWVINTDLGSTAGALALLSCGNDKHADAVRSRAQLCDSVQEVGDASVTVPTWTLPPHVCAEIVDVVGAAAASLRGLPTPEWRRCANNWAIDLPAELVTACAEAMSGCGYGIVNGMAVDDESLGPTPDPIERGQSVPFWDTLLTLLALRLGNPLSWPHHHGVGVVSDIAPSAHRAAEQSGAGSSAALLPHTEDAFHPRRCHGLVLAGLRNPSAAVTTVSSVREICLSDVDWGLFQLNAAAIVPDESYLAEPASVRAGYPRVAVVWDRDDGRCLRFDGAHTILGDESPEFRQAFGSLVEQLVRARRRIVVGPGDLLVLDNDVVVHGRAPFVARYDGTDRWLKRVIVRVDGRQRPPVEHDAYGEILEEPYSAAR
jgi:L-asparagine oxygenase